MATKFQRVVALLLSMLFVFGSLFVSVSAEDAVTTTSSGNERSLSSTAIASAKELLGTISYEEYSKKYSKDNSYPRATDPIVIAGTDYDKANTTAEVSVEEFDGVKGLTTGATGIVSYNVNVPKAGKYCINLKFYPIDAGSNSTAIQRIFRINGAVPFSEAYYITLSKVWKTEYDDAYKITTDKGDVRLFKTDVDNNEIRAAIVQEPEWCEYKFKDMDGFYKDPFEFVFEAGQNTISLEGVCDPMAIASITLTPYEEIPSYNDYIAKYAGAAKGTDKVKFEGEYPYRTSSNTIYPVEDRSSAVTSPCDTHRVLLNTLGGEKWQTAQQWITYQFTVNADGMYEIVPRFRQNVNDGMYSTRSLSIFSGDGVNAGENGYYNGVPFDEARELRFNYSTDWQATPLCYGIVTTDAKGNETIEYQNCEFYFKAGVTYTIKFEVALGTMGDVVRSVDSSLDVINEAYLNIMKLTGADPDEYRDYYFSSVMPDTVISLIHQSNKLATIAEQLTSLAGVKSSNVATLEKVSWLLSRMGSDPEDEIAKNLDQLKSYIGNLGTWLADAKTQPLQFDYIVIQSADEKLPTAKANFFQSLGHEFSSFIQSFIRNYDRMGASAENVAAADSIQVWNAYGRDQAQVIRNLINNDFTPATGIAVDLKLVAGGTLLPSILAGQGPDVYIGIGDDTIINYAIRGALEEVENMDGFYDFALNPETRQFNEAAMLVLGIPDVNNVMHYYGLPETQAFPMMFVRTDIMADLGIESLDTWDDLLEAATVLSQNSMTIGLSNDYKVFLYQMGGTLFADGGMRINLDSNLALDSFETMCNMFTMYSFPYKYDFTNRFRTGEMPIGIAGYNGTYNHLIVFATELRGLWEFVPMPGYELVDETTGEKYINNISVSSVSAIAMIAGCDQPEPSWEFMKWHSSDDCQINYSNEMIAILGDSAKHGTANVKALENMPWTNKERTNLMSQFQKLASIPNYPGAYIIGRYTKFAFLAAYDKNADPVNELLSYITTINKEITRKREEFELETLEIGQTLASKRRDMIRAAFDELDSGAQSQYASQIGAVRAVLDDIENNASFTAYCADSYIDALRAAGDGLKAADGAKFETICTYIETCANALKEYQASYPQN